MNYKTGNMSLKTSLTVTASGEDAFKLLTLINEAGLGNSISVTQEQAPLEGGIDLNELPGAVSAKVKEEAFAAGQGIVQMTEEDYLKLASKPPKANEVKAQKRTVNGRRTYFYPAMERRIRRAAADGKTAATIAKEFGIPYQSLYHWLKKKDIMTTRDKRGRKARS